MGFYHKPIRCKYLSLPVKSSLTHYYDTFQLPWTTKTGKSNQIARYIINFNGGAHIENEYFTTLSHSTGLKN